MSLNGVSDQVLERPNNRGRPGKPRAAKGASGAWNVFTFSHAGALFQSPTARLAVMTRSALPPNDTESRPATHAIVPRGGRRRRRPRSVLFDSIWCFIPAAPMPETRASFAACPRPASPLPPRAMPRRPPRTPPRTLGPGRCVTTGKIRGTRRRVPRGADVGVATGPPRAKLPLRPTAIRAHGREGVPAYRAAIRPVRRNAEGRQGGATPPSGRIAARWARAPKGASWGFAPRRRRRPHGVMRHPDRSPSFSAAALFRRRTGACGPGCPMLAPRPPTGGEPACR